MSLLNKIGLASHKKLKQAQEALQSRDNQIAEFSNKLESREKQVEEFTERFKLLEETSGIYKRRLAHIQKEVSETKKLTEAGYMFSGEDGEENYIEVGTSKYDLNHQDYSELQKQWVEIFKINPYAKRILEMQTDFIIGDGITYRIDDEQEKTLGPIMDKFWNDYDNDIGRNLDTMVTELMLFGEQVYPIIKTKDKSTIKIGNIDPRTIIKIRKDPNNTKRLWQVIVDGGQENKDRAYGVLNETPEGKMGIDKDQNKPHPDDSQSKEIEYIGEVVVFQINKLFSQARGYSELTTMLDTLDLLDQFVFQVAERSLLLFHYLMHVTCKGMGDEEIKKYRQKVSKTSSVLVTNEMVEIELMSPELQSVDAQNIVTTIVRYAMAGAGIPEHFIVAGDNTNYATAKEQGTPIEKRLERRQDLIRQMLIRLTRIQLEYAFPSAGTDEIQDYMDAITFQFPSIKGVDKKQSADVLRSLATALLIAVNANMITRESAAKAYIDEAERQGIELEEGDYEAFDDIENNMYNDPKVKAILGKMGKDMDNDKKQIPGKKKGVA